ncbi:MAG: nucleotidyltransferase family protein [Rhodospirillales bacterium]|nr:nucleotidyltransferase family protein [Rhodospirillales bacterium]MDS4012478.1 nucleotidyltransferase family protein [Defluviicoccus sp.]
MKDLAAILEDLRRLKPELAKRYPIKELGVFGSYARGEQRPDSDLDVLVDFDGPVGLLDFVGLQQDLSDELGVGVDLVMAEAPKPRIWHRIRAEFVVP